MFERMLAAAYLWHNYGKTPIGARADIERVPIERLQAFYKNTTSPTTPCCSWPASSTKHATLALVQRVLRPIPRPTRVAARAGHTSSRPRTASAR